MPRYLVTFDQPVVYLPDHPKGQQETSGLYVHADDPEQAKTHAIRVTRGPGQVSSVADA